MRPSSADVPRMFEDALCHLRGRQVGDVEAQGSTVGGLVQRVCESTWFLEPRSHSSPSGACDDLDVRSVDRARPRRR
ncbi:MAG: hypothetical protein JWL79_3859 [Frankiales bacterium]|nr:hypothetical protein [Frankiales bacterium]